MEKDTRTYMNLPTSEVIKPTDADVIDKVYRKFIKKFILKGMEKYYSENYIDYKLSKVDRIEMAKKLHYVGDTIFENGVLKLPDYFFTVKIESSKEAEGLIAKYPDLKDLLTTYGIYVISYDKHDSKEDKIIKNIIATYFATESRTKELAEITTAEKTFNGYATSNAILENVIRELALILGESALIETLKNGSSYLIKLIDIKTRKKGIGYKIIEDLVKLSELSATEKHRYGSCCTLNTIIKNKLLPVYEIIKKYDVAYQNAILNLIQMKDFDFSILGIIDSSINLTSIESLIETEKGIIKDFIQIFDTNWKDFYCLVTSYPEVKASIDDDGDKIYDGDSFTFLNKFLSVANQYESEYWRVCDSLGNAWKTLQQEIIYQLIPRYVKYNKRSNINLEEILRLSAYRTDKATYDLSEKPKTKKLQDKLKQ